MFEAEPTPSFFEALWADLPLVNIALFAWAWPHVQLCMMQPPARQLTHGFVFPLALLMGVYALRFRHAAPAERLVGLLVILVTAGGIVFDTRIVFAAPYSRVALQQLYETAVCINCVIMALHAWTRGGWPWLSFFFGPVALYGAILLNAGFALGFVHGMHGRASIPGMPAPAMAMLGWPVLVYQVTWMGWSLRRSVAPLRRSALLSSWVTAGAALLIVLQLDPAAQALGLWRWQEDLSLGWEAVPQLAFAAWTCGILPLTWVLFAREHAQHMLPGGITQRSQRRWIWWRLPVMLAAAASLCAGVMVLCEGPTGPTLTVAQRALSSFETATHAPPAPAAAEVSP